MVMMFCVGIICACLAMKARYEFFLEYESVKIIKLNDFENVVCKKQVNQQVMQALMQQMLQRSGKSI